jgi:hypothetical protein
MLASGKILKGRFGRMITVLENNGINLCEIIHVLWG